MSQHPEKIEHKGHNDSGTWSPRFLIRTACIAAVCGATLWMHWSTLSVMWEKWLKEAEYSHGWIIPLIAVMMLWYRRGIVGGKDTSPASVAGVVLLVGACLPLISQIMSDGWHFFPVPKGSETTISIVAGLLGTVGFSLLVADWTRRAEFHPHWTGLVLLAASLAVRLGSAVYYYEYPEFLTIVTTVAGLVLWFGGRIAAIWAWPSVLFLLFMIPLPFRLEMALKEPLRMVGTSVATYMFQTIGLPAYAEGFVVWIQDKPIGVEEVCSGMRMLMVFFALCTAAAVMSDRPLFEKILIVCSSIPIAIVANLIRIMVTGLFYAAGKDELAEKIFHDVAGLLMMPLGLAMLWIGLLVMDRLIVVEERVPFMIDLQ